MNSSVTSTLLIFLFIKLKYQILMKENVLHYLNLSGLAAHKRSLTCYVSHVLSFTPTDVDKQADKGGARMEQRDTVVRLSWRAQKQSPDRPLPGGKPVTRLSFPSRDLATIHDPGTRGTRSLSAFIHQVWSMCTSSQLGSMDPITPFQLRSSSSHPFFQPSSQTSESWF